MDFRKLKMGEIDGKHTSWVAQGQGNLFEDHTGTKSWSDFQTKLDSLPGAV